MIDDAGKFGAAADKVAGRELTFEDRVLEMIAITTHGFEDLAESAVVANVVADEIRLAHVRTFDDSRKLRAYPSNGTIEPA